MKKYKITTIGAFLTLVFVFFIANINANAADKNTKTTECKVSVNVQSFYDKDLIEKELKQHSGIIEAFVDLEDKIAYITYEKSVTNSENVCKVIKDLGFSAKVIEEKDKNLGLK